MIGEAYGEKAARRFFAAPMRRTMERNGSVQPD
jgi:hypothetical protein